MKIEVKIGVKIGVKIEVEFEVKIGVTTEVTAEVTSELTTEFLLKNNIISMICNWFVLVLKNENSRNLSFGIKFDSLFTK